MSGAEVEVSGLSKHFGKIRVIENLQFNAQPGEFIVIVGPSGCGKTTLLRLLAGLIEPSSGTLTVAGEVPSRLRSKGALGYMSQDSILLPWRTVFSNVALPLEILNDIVDKDERVSSWVAAVGLSEFAEASTSRLNEQK